jgi:hypothetical protein
MSYFYVNNNQLTADQNGDAILPAALQNLFITNSVNYNLSNNLYTQNSLTITKSQSSSGDIITNNTSTGIIAMTLDLYASGGNVSISAINLRLSGLVNR